MKSSNLFRFVSIRPPVPPSGSQAMEELKGPDEVVRPLVQEVESSDSGRKPSEIRAELGAELLASTDYYVRNPISQRILHTGAQLTALIADAPALDEFRRSVTAILSSALGRDLNLDQFISDEQFQTLTKVFWRGYLGNLLSPDGTPSAREETTNWIRVLSLLDATRRPDDYAHLLSLLPRLRPTVPGALFRSDPPETLRPAESRADSDRLSQRGRVHKQIGQLREARRAIKRISSRKLSRSMQQTEVPIFHVVAPTETATDPAEVKRPRARDSERPAPTEVPWQLTSDDLRDRPEVRTVLEKLDIDPTLASVPDLVNTLDRHIASLYAEAEALSTSEESVLIGGALRRISRRLPPIAPAEKEDER